MQNRFFSYTSIHFNVGIHAIRSHINSKGIVHIEANKRRKALKGRLTTTLNLPDMIKHIRNNDNQELKVNKKEDLYLLFSCVMDKMTNIYRFFYRCLGLYKMVY